MRFAFIVLILGVLVFDPGVATANTAPVADPGGPYKGTTDATQPILFNGSASSDADGDFLGYIWDFGDGTTGTGITTFHAYSGSGVFVVSLTVNDGIATDTETAIATISLKAPKNPTPASGAPFISFPLQLDWENVLGAQSYRYELYREDGEPKEFLVTQSQNDVFDSDVLKFLEPQRPYSSYQDECKTSDGDFDDDCTRTLIKQHQQRLWHVKSCEDTEGTVCGPWGAVWDFTYLLGPAVLNTPATNSTDVSLPVTLDWDDVPGTKSYELFTLPCPPWGREDPDTGCYSIPIPPLNGILTSRYSDSKIPVFLQWEKTNGAKAYSYEISLDGAVESDGSFKNKLKGEVVSEEQNLLEYETGVIEHNKEYWWHVKACTDEKGETCGPWGSISQFNTFVECLFTRQSEYGWQVASCLDSQASFCTHPDDVPSQSFSTSSFAPDLPAPKLLGPLVKDGTPPKNPVDLNSIPPISQNDVLRWSGSTCAYFNRINVFNEAGTRITQDDCAFSGSACTQEIGDETLLLKDIKRLWDQPEDLDKMYSWSVTPCWDKNSTYGCTGATDSEQWYFHTEGKPPMLTVPGDNTSTKVPILLSWQGDGASYHYQVAKDVGFTQIAKEGGVQGTSVEIAYAPPNIVLETSYWWHVKTCVDTEGNVCGPWSTTFQFTTFPLETPSGPNPPSGGQTSLPGYLSWVPDPGANYYTYQVQYTSLVYGENENGNDLKETLGGCDKKAGSWLIPPKKVGKFPITSQPNFYLSEQCLGQYRWQVASCIDKDCAIAQPPDLDNAPVWMFTAVEQATSGQGLVPCGRTVNDPHTPYNEREACQLKHAGFLLQNLLDFILWKVSLFVLLVLAVITGATSYFSLGGPNALARVKTVFRSFLAGFLVLVFAWMFVNTILVLFGFQFEFFGKWWEITF